LQDRQVGGLSAVENFAVSLTSARFHDQPVKGDQGGRGIA
jgi:hypothetical protein